VTAEEEGQRAAVPEEFLEAAVIRLDLPG